MKSEKEVLKKITFLVFGLFILSASSISLYQQSHKPQSIQTPMEVIFSEMGLRGEIARSAIIPSEMFYSEDTEYEVRISCNTNDICKLEIIKEKSIETK